MSIVIQSFKIINTKLLLLFGFDKNEVILTLLPRGAGEFVPTKIRVQYVIILPIHKLK